MFIIGTAGHVDHGKTLLIKALTGIDTDRLPEEKKRGLTIDLGFAHFTGTDGRQIGVVDVPGHERFIRNMTAGAWGIDLALLVIAADDGWMPQTENHLRVLLAMGIRKIIITVTKTDLADSSRIQEVRDLAEELISGKTGMKGLSVAVSARTGEGIQELKALIQTELSSGASDGPALPEIPLLYIDRVFSIRGAGVVVTGSLREGSINRGDSLVLLPEGREIRVRGLQTHEKDVETIAPAARAAVNITGVSPNEISRGNCITGKVSQFTAEEEAVILLSSARREIRNHSGIEIATGTAHSIGMVHFIGESLCARLVIEKKTALRTGQPVVIIQKGGSRIIGAGAVIWKGSTSREERVRISGASERITLPLSVRHRLLIELAVSGWTDAGSDKAAADFPPREGKACGKWIFRPDFLEVANSIIEKGASMAGGVKTAELMAELNLPAEVVSGLCGSLSESGRISFRNSTWFKNTGEGPTLTDDAKTVLMAAEKEGIHGLDLGKIRIPGVHKQLRILTRAGLIVPLTENLFYTSETFQALCGKILDGLDSGDCFDIAHAKESTGLSRKYIIPILEKMEELNMVVREESARRVV